MNPVSPIRTGLLMVILLGSLAGLRAESPASEAYTWGVQARLKEMHGDIDGAIADYDKAIAVYPQDAQPFNARGALKKAKGDLAGAIADYDKAIALKPKQDLGIIYANRGSAKHESDDFAGALADYDEALALKPDYAVVYNNRGTIKKAQGRLDDALADFDKSIALEPAAIQFHINRAGARLANGDKAGAVADYDQAVTLNPKRTMSYFERGNFRRLLNDLEGSIADFSKLVELRPDSPFSYHYLAVSRHAQGDYEAALADYNKAMAAELNSAALSWPYRDIVLRQLHRRSPFGEQAKTVASWNEGWAKSIGLYLIEALSEADFIDRAKHGSAVNQMEQQCEVFYFVGMLRLLAGNPDEARSFFEQCLALKLTDSDSFILARAELARLPAAH